MKVVLVFVGAAALAASALVVMTRDPDAIGVVLLVASVALAVGAIGTLAGIWLEERAAAGVRARRGASQRLRAMRRGLGLGAIVAALGLLRVVDGLTLVTGGFVVAGFALAELVLATRSAASSR